MKQKLVIAMLFVIGLALPQIVDAQAKIGLNIGDKAPEIAEKTADGIRAEIVFAERSNGYIIDFWAFMVWALPTREPYRCSSL